MAEIPNFSNVNFDTVETDGNVVPKLHFGADTLDTRLRPEKFVNDGNVITAYYDAEHKLIFIVDETVLDIKPNSWLIINQINDRKWDDILSNDYGMELENIRPKKNNRYQKLDIDYDGLIFYSNLLRDYAINADTSNSLNELNKYREITAMKNATARFDAANEIIETSATTILRTTESVMLMKSRLKKLNEKLKNDKKQIGRVDSKKIASKILKTESMIEKINSDIKRAQKRIKNAQRKINAGQKDMNAAREILNKVGTPIMAEKKDVNEEVKPLFDTDPKIINESMAFQPIEFNAETQKPTVPAPVEEPVVAQPVKDKPETIFAPIEIPDIPVPSQVVQPEPQPEPVIEKPVVEDFTFVPPAPLPQPEPVVEQSPFDEAMGDKPPRPVSPITGTIEPIAQDSGDKPVVSETPTGRRQSPLYFIMLGILILLSVFTLWLYQSKMNNGTPNIAAPVAPVEQPISEPEPMYEPEPVVVESINEPSLPVMPVPEPIMEPVIEEVYAEPMEEYEEVAPMPEPVIEPEYIEPATLPARVSTVYVSGNERNDALYNGPNYNTYEPDMEEIAPQAQDSGDNTIVEENPWVDAAPAVVSESEPVKTGPTDGGMTWVIGD